MLVFYYFSYSTGRGAAANHTFYTKWLSWFDVYFSKSYSLRHYEMSSLQASLKAWMLLPSHHAVEIPSHLRYLTLTELLDHDHHHTSKYQLFTTGFLILPLSWTSFPGFLSLLTSLIHAPKPLCPWGGSSVHSEQTIWRSTENTASRRVSHVIEKYMVVSIPALYSVEKSHSAVLWFLEIGPLVFHLRKISRSINSPHSLF